MTVLFKEKQWEAALYEALKPAVKTIAANIVKSDIQLVYEDINQSLPFSPIGKLSVILYNRFQKFEGDKNKGLKVVTPHLITDSVVRLESLIIELAHRNNYDPQFIDWIEESNYFTNYGDVINAKFNTN